MNTQKQFDPNKWAARFREIAGTAMSNDMMDTGWSARTAHACDAEFNRLYRELFEQLKTVEIASEDFFDRPALAAVLAAVHEAGR